MSWCKRLPCLVLPRGRLAVTPARAQVAGHPVEAVGSVPAGSSSTRATTSRTRCSAAPRWRYRYSTGLTIEGAWQGTTTKRAYPYPDNIDHTFTWTRRWTCAGACATPRRR